VTIRKVFVETLAIKQPKIKLFNAYFRHCFAEFDPNYFNFISSTLRFLYSYFE
jgi:hypothetical protein